LSIRVIDVHVDYELFGDRRGGLRERFTKRNMSGRTVVRAVRGVSFDVCEGEAVGIVGFNGSGKSTLLSAIGGVLPVTSGEVLVADDPKLMGVNAALIPQSSGFRNLRLGCLALGLTNDEVDERIDDLVAFTELGDAIHRPLRTYSSGMRARVHFALATAVHPRILLIDEALAVGDRKFRAKSRTRIREIIEGAGTLLMVNHALAELASHCSRGLWLDEGRLLMDGPIDEVIAAYSSAA
jgi:teichoic acid transport system ATP-binding protein